MTTEATTRKPNRLIHEKSPYLLQHAYNPVDWFPWGQEAFDKAHKENKPIFLSIGYSTCHWCHVMEHESFENDAVAAVMNKFFVCIKLDREERPDLDKIYMTAVQATTGSGGWPMSVWMTPDRKPFFCGTYFPPASRGGRPGFTELLQRVHDVWESNHDAILDQADKITASLMQNAGIHNEGGDTPVAPDDKPLALGFEQFHGSFDAAQGGFGGAPKFPRPVSLNFLFRYFGRTGDEKARDMALHTLRAMAEGGLQDQLGGGFHRYSVDDHWLVSHFEKMLYDQAQLVTSYVIAWQITHDPFYATAAQRTCDYVLRDMTSPDGGFYSAEDADSEGVEGKFYVWTRAEIEKALGDKALADVFCRYYGVSQEGNWEHGLNILHVTLTLAQTAKYFQKSENEINALIDAARAKLFAARAKRIRPHRDDKVITSWNGLMISALCQAAQTLPDEPARDKYRRAAQRAAQQILQHQFKDGRLMRTTTVAAVADDYAFFANALVDLYETNFDPQWLTQAISLTDTMLAQFYDPSAGGFFMNCDKDPHVIVRAKEDYDGAEPSSNSVATLLLLRLAQFTDKANYRDAALKTLGLFGTHLHRMPHAVPLMLCALDWALSQPKQVIIAGQTDSADTQTLLRAVREQYLPNKIVLLADGGAAQARLAKLLPFVAAITPLRGQATAHVCVNYACQLPTTDRDAMLKQLTVAPKTRAEAGPAH